MEQMHVTKRSGAVEAVNLNKIVRAVTKSAAGLDSVDPMRVATKVVAGLYNGVTTKEIEQLAIQVTASLTSDEPQYARLAAVLLSNSIDKDVDDMSFAQSIRALYDVGLVNERVLTEVEGNKRKYNQMIVRERTKLFEYFGLRTLEDRYLLRHPQTRKVMENPQYMFLRIAVALSDCMENAQVLYNAMSNLEYLPSTPTLLNSGRVREQLSSCFLVESPEDSLEGIYKMYTDIAKLSKFSGGIGVSTSRIRSNGSLIKGTNGKSKGVVPWLKTLDASVASVDQGGSRKGACAVYLEPWHADIEDFLELRDNTGDEYRRTHNLNLANWVPDIFMRRVEADAAWSLFDPVDVPNFPDLYGEDFDVAYEAAEAKGLAKKTMKARDLYGRMMKTLTETGNGWMTFKDTSNSKSNQTLRKENVIHSSNLCVAPETKILTDKGYFEIVDLLGEKANVWNGSEWSEVKIKQTGKDVELIKVLLSNGVEIECTPEHKFALSNGYRTDGWTMVAAADLVVGAKLAKFEMPVIQAVEGNKDTEATKRLAYANGFFCGDGTYSADKKNTPRTTLYGVKKDLSDYLDVDGTARPDNSDRINIYYKETKLAPKFSVPTVELTVAERLSWFAGLLDSDGTVARNGANESLQIGSVNLEFLQETRLMLTTLGIDAKVTKSRDAGQTYMPDGRGGHRYFPTQTAYRLLLSSIDTYNLTQLGLPVRRLSLKGNKPQRNARHFTTVVAIEWTERIADTYCFTEPKKNLGTFNGVVTGQCVEILEVNNHENTAVCNLCSLNLAKHMKQEDGKWSFDFAKLASTVEVAVRQLDRVIDLNFYTIPETKTSNMHWRPVGLGLMGLQDVFFMLDLPFDSQEARELSRKISERIYFHALTTSCQLAQNLGKHEGFEDTRMSQGVFQFDLWGVAPSADLDWEQLRKDIVQHGLRNSLLVAIAPTATIASIAGCYECIEPQVSNTFKRETMSGDFIQVNKYLVAYLKSVGAWDENSRNILKAQKGSVKNIENMDEHAKQVFRTVWEIPMRSIIDMAAERGAFIDQSQSLNLFMESPSIPKASSMFMHAFKSGLKTTYYLRSRPATEIAKATISVNKKTYTDEEAMACSIENPSACDACSLGGNYVRIKATQPWFLAYPQTNQVPNFFRAVQNWRQEQLDCARSQPHRRCDASA